LGVELEILCGYEGSNPQEEQHIEWIDEGAVRVLPQSEDGDSNYKFAFDITLRNPSGLPLPLRLEVDWQEPPEVGTLYMEDREFTFVYDGEGWHEVRGQLDQDKVHFALVILPGESRVCLHPPFGTCEMAAFFQDASRLEGAKRFSFGQTAGGRPMEAALAPSLGVPELCLLLVGRLHPYESAGSYVVWGALDLLAGERGHQLREACTFILVPLANPDGVAHGLCKRTAWCDGVDLSAEGNQSNDPTACALRGIIAGVASGSARSILLDVHGWMNREDGIWVYRQGQATEILARLGGRLFPSGWQSTIRSLGEGDADTTDLRQYAAGSLGMETVVTSTPWFGRRPAVVRQIGARVADAVLQVLR
jgi:hypothetical protein